MPLVGRDNQAARNEELFRMTSFDYSAFRGHFPALSAKDNEQHAVYLDSAATALKPQALVEATQAYYAGSAATVHRSQHQAALRLTQRYESARQQVAQLLHAHSADSIVWTKGTTEAINLVAQSYLRPILQAGDEILVSEAEHHANLIPWLMVAEQCGANVVKLPVNQNGLPALEQLPALLTSRTKMMALGQMSNVTGGCPDLRYALELAHQNGTPVMIDGAQGVVHHPLDVTALNVDFYAFSAHKMYGPTGLGVLYGKPEYLAQMHAWQGGGKMLTKAGFDGFIEQAIPHRFEAGTPNIAGVIGFSAVLEWLEHFDLAAAEAYCVSLAEQAEQQFSQIKGFISYRAPKSALLAFNIAGIHHSDLVALVAEQGVALRAGQHCAQPLIQALGITGSLRVSFAPYNCPEDVTTLVKAVNYALSILNDEDFA